MKLNSNFFQNHNQQVEQQRLYPNISQGALGNFIDLYV